MTLAVRAVSWVAVYLGAVLAPLVFAVIGASHPSRFGPTSRSHWDSGVEGGLIPVLTLLVAWAAGVSVTSAVRAAVWTTAVTIVVLELAAGHRARLRPKRFLAQAGAGVAMGLAIVALNLLLH